ncbi:MAG: GldG family protein [Oscillospiraceae bacterium]|nr:GldG family protein [Oscillospiraceae bacterium]
MNTQNNPEREPNQAPETEEWTRETVEEQAPDTPEAEAPETVASEPSETENGKEKKGSGRLRAAFNTKAWRAGSYSIFAAIVVIAIAVVVNLVVNALPSSGTQLDMTENQIYSISDQTKQILGSLETDVEVYWIVQSGSEDSTMEQVLAKYAEYSHVTVTSVDPVVYPSFASQYTDETITNNSLLVVCGDRTIYIPYSDIWTYSDYSTYYYYYYYYGEEYLDVFAGESQLTSAIGYVTSDDLPIMYILTGHGESGVSDDVLDAINMDNIQTEELSLLTVDAIPEDCAVLALFGPTSDLSADEVAMIEAYLAEGGEMIITTEYTEEDMTNFQTLLSDWGLDLTYGYVLESNSSYYYYGYIDLILPTLGSHDITSPLTEDGYSVLMPDAQGLTEIGENDDLTVTALLTSSSSSYIKESLSGLTSYEQTEDDPSGPFMLGAAVESASSGGKLVVFTSTLFMESDYSSLVSGANEDLFLNAVDWLCEKDSSISIHTKTISSDYLSFSDSSASTLKTLLVIVVPVLFLASGVVIFIRRRRR